MSDEIRQMPTGPRPIIKMAEDTTPEQNFAVNAGNAISQLVGKDLKIPTSQIIERIHDLLLKSKDKKATEDLIVKVMFSSTEGTTIEFSEFDKKEIANFINYLKSNSEAYDTAMESIIESTIEIIGEGVNEYINKYHSDFLIKIKDLMLKAFTGEF